MDTLVDETRLPSVCSTNTPDYWHERGLLEKGAGNAQNALDCFIEAMRRINRFWPSFEEIKNVSEDYFIQGMNFKAQGNDLFAISMLVKALELNPDNDLTRKNLLELLMKSTRFDYTKHCFISRKSERAKEVRYEAFLRCIEFLTTSGIVGDICEFGVLAGWSARILSEIMRDEMFFGNLHLFDSFQGLPVMSSSIDNKSFDVSGRNLWRDNMRFSDEFIDQLGSSMQDHIFTSLSEVLSPSRIKIHTGFYDSSLKEISDFKTALVHIDCDLYQSTVDVLEGLATKKAFQDGCVLIFDDWNCNKGNPNYGERRAFSEFMLKYSNIYDASPFFTYGHNGAVFILHHKA